MSTHTIVVTGDVVADHHIYAGERPTPDAVARAGTQIREQLGGAALLCQLLEEVFKPAASSQPAAAQVHFGLDADSLKTLPGQRRSYALWSPCAGVKDPGGKDTGAVWRITAPLGYGAIFGTDVEGISATIASGLPAKPHIVVIDDGGLGFRFWPSRSQWPIDVEKQQPFPTWIVLKMSAPVGQGDLWRGLSKHYADRLVVLVSAGDLRREQVRISQGISWERTVEDLVDEFDRNPIARELLACRHLVVTLRGEGALWLDLADRGEPSATLVFDPDHIEGEWGREIQGETFGYMSCIAAALTRELASSQQITEAAIKHGLAATRRLRLAGHGLVTGANPGFPFADVAREISGGAGQSSSLARGFSSVPVPSGDARARCWGRDWMMPGRAASDGGTPRPLFGAATRIARFGLKTIDNIPVGRFGKLATVDRHEIESLRTIRRLMEDYAAAPSSGKPLSLAVFGPPGAGKSFGIKQIAEGVLGKAVPILEFNLSQFHDPNDLIGAWHEVRDRALQGTTPVVFWDEFDAREYEWLQYFLAPMQDGKFQEGQVTHTVGKCIFVFAGATSSSLDAFGPRPTDEAGQRHFKLRKGPDFISRLHGHLAVLGPNRRLKVDLSTGTATDDPDDVCYPVRRALLLRALLGLGPKDLLDIDAGLLDALLEIDHYKYGARSMEMIAAYLKRRGGSSLRRSHLPAAEVMKMHLTFERFMKLCDRARDFQAKADTLAPAIHEIFRRLGRERGWPTRYDMDYRELPENVKADNVAAAIRIPEILGLVGLQVVTVDDPAPYQRAQVQAILEEHLDVLSAAEHDGWMDYKVRNGWRKGKEGERDDENRIQPALVPYESLDEKNRDKDRNSVRHFPDMVELAGFKIVPNTGSSEPGAGD